MQYVAGSHLCKVESLYGQFVIFLIDISFFC